MLIQGLVLLLAIFLQMPISWDQEHGEGWGGNPSRELKLCSWLYKFSESPRRAYDPLMDM